jgi:hypothetical protein
MLTKLLEIQRREGYTDGQMAAELGISRPLWNLVKNGRTKMSDNLAVKAAGAFPELTRDLIDRAANTVTSAPNNGAKAA